MSEYDKNGNLLYYRVDTGFECWREYDENDNEIHYRNNKGQEYWYKWNKNKKIEITEKEFKEIEFRKKEKEYLSRTKCSRFELMDI